MIIPDTLIGFDLLMILFCFVFYNKTIFDTYTFNSFEVISSIIFVILIFSIVLMIQLIYKKEILGYGDIKLLLVFGLLYGITKTLFGLFVGSLIALTVELLKKNYKNKEFPYGPYLILGFVISNLLFDKFYFMINF